MSELEAKAITGIVLYDDHRMKPIHIEQYKFRALEGELTAWIKNTNTKWINDRRESQQKSVTNPNKNIKSNQIPDPTSGLNKIYNIYIYIYI